MHAFVAFFFVNEITRWVYNIFCKLEGGYIECNWQKIWGKVIQEGQNIFREGINIFKGTWNNLLNWPKISLLCACVVTLGTHNCSVVRRKGCGHFTHLAGKRLAGVDAAGDIDFLALASVCVLHVGNGATHLDSFDLTLSD